MAHIEKSIRIDAPRDEVFAYMSHIPAWPEWFSSITEVRSCSQEQAETDVTYEWTYKMAGIKIQGGGRYAEVVPLERLLTVNEAGVASTFDWRLSDDPAGGTHVAVTIEYTLPGKLIGKLADKLIFERYNEREAEHALQNLKTICEAHAREPKAADAATG